MQLFKSKSLGNETHYISLASLLRVATLSNQILWDKNQLVLTADLDEIEEDDINFMKKDFTKFTATLAHVPSMIMTMICCAALIICIIFSDIQYLMCILEFIIVTGIGAFFIPFILFDGTKEMPKKLVPVFTGFLIKMITMNIIVFQPFLRLSPKAQFHFIIELDPIIKYTKIYFILNEH